jgi:hypothetical protein
LKVKDKVYHYKIKMDFIKNSVEQEKKEYTVIGANNHYLCIDDSCFTSLKIKGYYRGDEEEFNIVSTFHSNYGSSCDYIQADLYTATSSEKIAYKRMKKALEKFIYEKYGRYCNAIDFLDKIQI